MYRTTIEATDAGPRVVREYRAGEASQWLLRDCCESLKSSHAQTLLECAGVEYTGANTFISE